MNDEVFDLESRLAALKPRRISLELELKVARAAKRPDRAAESFFWSVTATGTIDASLIVAMLVGQSNSNARPVPLAEVVARVPAGSAPLAVLARADVRWGDDFGLNDSPIRP